MRINLRKSTEPKLPTLEEDMAEAVANMKYAPPDHADRISATAKVMADAVRAVAAETRKDLTNHMTDLRTRVQDIVQHIATIEEGVEVFNREMDAEIDTLVAKIQAVLAKFEETKAKLAEVEQLKSELTLGRSLVFVAPSMSRLAVMVQRRLSGLISSRIR